MTYKNYDVVIAIRTYPGTKLSRSRAIFHNDKYKLVEICLKSLKDSLGVLKFKIFAILDGCPKEWEDLFRRYFDNEELEVFNLNRVGDIGSFNFALDLLIKQKYSEIIYIADDDYFYLPNQFEKMIKFLKNDPDADFIAPYDHIDHYKLALHDYHSKIKIFAKKHWRTISTTCGTYLTTKKTLYQTLKIFQSSRRSYSKNFLSRVLFFKKFFPGSTDADLWLCLTKLNVFNFFKIIRYLFLDRDTFIFYFKAWRYNWKQILFGKKWKLWCPIPTIATHMEKQFLAPTIDWKNIFKKEIEKIN